jgi:hypothetical protein
VGAPLQDEAQRGLPVGGRSDRCSIVVAPAWCLCPFGRRGASNHVNYLSRSPRRRLEELGDVCSALANRFARPSWKFRAPSARAQNKGDQKRAAPTGCSNKSLSPKPYRSIRSSPRVELLLLLRARGGERGRERRLLGVCGGDCCKQVVTALAPHDGDARRSTSWLCRFYAPAATAA